jgi:hypothetical protein
MAESKFPALRTALNQALGGIRSGFGRITGPATQVSPEGHDFLNRLEEVLGIELQDAEPGPHPQRSTARPALAGAQPLEPFPVHEASVRTELIAQASRKPGRKRKAAEKATPEGTSTKRTGAKKSGPQKTAAGKKRTGKSVPLRKAKKRS